MEVKTSGQTAAFGPIGPQRPFVHDYPAEYALATFKQRPANGSMRGIAP